MRRFLLLLGAMALLAGCNEPRYQNRGLSSWVYDLTAKDDFKRRAACEALAAMGPEAAPAIPDLIATFEDTNEGVQAFAEVALAKIGPAAVPALVPLLKAPKPGVRLHAAAALTGIDPGHKEAITELVKAATGVGNIELAHQAQEVVVRLGEPAVPQLLPFLDDPYPPVRLQVVKTLGKMGDKARGAVDGLQKKMVEGKGTEIRLAAMNAFAKIATREQSEPALRALLDDPEGDLADNAGVLLQYIGARESATGYGEEEDAAPTADKKPAKKRGRGR